jgi:hypothetical protein
MGFATAGRALRTVGRRPSHRRYCVRLLLSICDVHEATRRVLNHEDFGGGRALAKSARWRVSVAISGQSEVYAVITLWSASHFRAFVACVNAAKPTQRAGMRRARRKRKPKGNTIRGQAAPTKS